jgi:hypothetical protein
MERPISSTVRTGGESRSYRYSHTGRRGPWRKRRTKKDDEATVNTTQHGTPSRTSQTEGSTTTDPTVPETSESSSSITTPRTGCKADEDIIVRDSKTGEIVRKVMRNLCAEPAVLEGGEGNCPERCTHKEECTP